VASNFEISVGDAVNVIARAMGVDVSVDQDPDRIRPAGSEVERLWGCNAKAERLAGWRPEYGGLAGFERGIRETIEWFTHPTNLARYKHDIYNV
jgi:dTDP-glucose 4,6-dehydratase